MDFNLKDYDLSDAPIEIELEGVKYSVDRARQRHYIATRDWLIASRMQTFMGDTVRFHMMPAEAAGIAVAKIACAAPTNYEIATDSSASCHLMAQAITMDGSKVTYPAILDVKHFDELLAIWNGINAPRGDTSSDPTTDGESPAT